MPPKSNFNSSQGLSHTGRPTHSSARGSSRDSTVSATTATDDGAEHDFRARAMAMYQTRGKAETMQAARSVKQSVSKAKSKELAENDYHNMAMKLYNMEPTAKWYRVLRGCELRKTIDPRSKVVGKAEMHSRIKGLRQMRGRGVGKELETPDGWLTTAVLNSAGEVETVVELERDGDEGEVEETKLLRRMATKATAAGAKKDADKVQAAADSAKAKGAADGGGDATGDQYEMDSSSSEELGSDWSSEDEVQPDIHFCAIPCAHFPRTFLSAHAHCAGRGH